MGCADDEAPSCPDGRHAVTLNVGVPPLVAAYRDGSADWETPAVIDDATLQMCVRDDYVVFVTCFRSPGEHLTQQIAATYQDAPLPYLAFSCAGSASTDPEPVVVHARGSTSSYGLVSLGNAQRAQSIGAVNQMFALDVYADTYNLVASNDVPGLVSSRHVLARRGLHITNDTAIDDIDFETEGEATIDAPLVVLGIEPAETVRTKTSWALGDALPIAVATTKTAVPRMLPASLVAPGDTVWFDFAATQPTYGRYLELAYTGQYSTSMPPRLTTATLQESSATWTSLPMLSRVYAQFVGRNTLALIATRRWLDANPRTRLAIEPGIPGYDDSWSAPSGGFRSFGVVNETSEATTEVTISDPAN